MKACGQGRQGKKRVVIAGGGGEGHHTYVSLHTGGPHLPPDTIGGRAQSAQRTSMYTYVRHIIICHMCSYIYIYSMYTHFLPVFKMMMQNVMTAAVRKHGSTISTQGKENA